MNKYKICVYAIAYNEEKFVSRWMESVKDADGVYVLDTGSTDKTKKLLKKYGATVKTKKIEPCLFDSARNLSLNMVPDDTDICICLDLDEVLMPGWRSILENTWDENTTRMQYTYNWRLDENDKPIVSFYADKVHARKNYKWIYPVHEVLASSVEQIYKTSDEFTINHYPDDKKSRSSYLPLLELSVKEDPTNDRNMHYLGREYMYYGRWNECIDTLIKHLHLKSSTWKDERCASMRFIARSYINLNRFDEAEMWLLKAIKEAPYLRDPYVEMMLLKYKLGDYESIIKYGKEALKIKNNQKSYINEIFSWNETIYDLLSLAYYYTGDIDNAIKNVDIAISINPDDERMQKNRKIFMQSKNLE